MNYLFLSIILLLGSCASTVPQVKKKKKVPFQLSSWSIREGKVPVGEVTSLKLPLNFPNNLTIKCDGKKVDVGIFPRYKVAFVSISYSEKVGRQILCRVQKNKKNVVIARYQVVDKSFPSERLMVDKKRVFLSKKDRRRVATEQVFLNSNYFNPSEVALFQEGFRSPLNSFITSIYGSRRVFNKKKMSKHLGTDFRAAIGTEIPAANSGRVVVSRDLFYTGYTVTIDHGLGIFTIYGHLSKPLVKEGEMVTKGQTIALSGNTGRTSGPHLHWGVRVHHEFIDGHSLIAATQDL